MEKAFLIKFEIGRIYICIVFTLCSVSFIVCVVLCAVLFFSVVCYFV
jgi:hypothetical protein